MIKTLFWDMDGTLLSTIKNFWSHTFYQCVLSEGYECDFETIYDIVNTTEEFSWLFPQISYTDRTNDLWWKTLEDGLARRLIKTGFVEDKACKASRKLKGMVLRKDNFIIYEDAKAILEYTKNEGYENILLSNNYPEADQVLEMFDLAQYFDRFVISAQVGYEKPRREIFEIALENRDPQECIMIGDNPICDIEGAINMHMHTILVHSEKESKAEYSCSTLLEIKNIL